MLARPPAACDFTSLRRNIKPVELNATAGNAHGVVANVGGFTTSPDLEAPAAAHGQKGISLNRSDPEAPAGQFGGTKGAAAAGVGTALDFVAGYADYADVLEAPRMVHEIVGIQLVAGVLNRREVTVPNGAVMLSLDLWTLLLSGSGAGRSTTVGMATPVLQAAGIADLSDSVRWGSAPALFQHFADNPCGLQMWPEMGERLKLLNQAGFETAKEWLTDRYDNLAVPASIRYRATGKKADTPPIVFNRAPRINILATSAEAWFFNNLLEADAMGGFLPRWLPVQMETGRRDVAIPRPPDPALISPLAERLKQIAGLSGQADLSAVRSDFEHWYTDTKSRFLKHPNTALADAYFNRHRNHVLKMAVIFEVSAGGTLKVSRRAWAQAVEFMGRVERAIFRLLPTGMSAQGYLLQRMEERVKLAGREGISRNELTRCFQAVKSREREEALTTLQDAERIDARTLHPTSVGGRRKTVYVHEKFRQPDA
jgi:hypothetical protein